MAVFKVPEKIIHGAGQLKALGRLKGKRATLVTGGSSMKRSGVLDRAIGFLESAGLEVQVLDGVSADPTIQACIDGGHRMVGFEPDWIIALGGGSSLDAAKVMWVYYEHPDYDFDLLIRGKFPALRTKAKLVGIPSTSGTASEITSFAVVTDPEAQTKYPLFSPQIVPDMAIIDPEIPASMPPLITAQTGMDVLTHAIEAYVSTAADDYTDALALQSIRLVFSYLETAYRHPENMEARTKMHNASTLAGMAFSNCSLGIVHSMAHKIGGRFHLTHGEANAVILPYVIDYNRRVTPKYARLEGELGIDDLAVAVRNLNERVGLSADLGSGRNTVIAEADFRTALSEMSRLAFEDGCTLTNPRKTSPEEIEQLFVAAYYGKPVDF
jgi:alcohol dehydrogenase class IV